MFNILKKNKIIINEGINRAGALHKAFNFIYKNRTTGNYLEFGVYKGQSSKLAIEINNTFKKKFGFNLIETFYGFDSFEGLPEIDNENDNSKIFKNKLFNDTNFETINSELKGLFKNEKYLLHKIFFKDLKTNLINNNPPAIIHIDCDLYNSTIEVLNFIYKFKLSTTVLLFDDFFSVNGSTKLGQAKAFYESKFYKNYNITDYFNYSWAGKAFICNKN